MVSRGRDGARAPVRLPMPRQPQAAARALL